MKYTIKKLRQSGYKVRVLHSRRHKNTPTIDGSRMELLANGGSTVIEMTTPNKQYTVRGEAICSLEDNFNRRVGNEIALGRALVELRKIPEYSQI